MFLCRNFISAHFAEQWFLELLFHILSYVSSLCIHCLCLFATDILILLLLFTFLIFCRRSVFVFIAGGCSWWFCADVNLIGFNLGKLCHRVNGRNPSLWVFRQAVCLSDDGFLLRYYASFSCLICRWPFGGTEFVDASI